MSDAATTSTSCLVRVVVRDDAAPEVVIHDRSGDHNDRGFRDWITKTTWWALRNGKAVHYYPIKTT